MHAHAHAHAHVHVHAHALGASPSKLNENRFGNLHFFRRSLLGPAHSRRPLHAAALAKRREGGRVVEVENLLFDARPARDARGCRVLPSLLLSAVPPRSEETYGPRAYGCGRRLAHPPVAAGGAGGGRRVDHALCVLLVRGRVSCDVSSSIKIVAGGSETE